ncbi:MAG: hypothetical protein D6762_09250 [Candidatus Neomarinimicrobiota bacterium]|nr:MAG: hypothetical protein D6762_09250 [Candidatus Neomarinimicrobiota bacterium]
MKVWILTLILITGGLAQQTVVWPSPPDTARIQLEDVISDPEEPGHPPNLLEQIRRFLRPSVPHRFVRPLGVDARDNRLAVADPGAGGVFVFRFPQPVATFLPVVDPDGNLPVDVALSTDRLIVVLSPEPKLAYYSLSGDLIRTITLGDQAVRLTGITTVGNHLFVVDTGGHRLLELDSQGRVVAALGSRGTEPGAFNFPTFVAAGPDGRLYITDTMNFRVQVLSPEEEVRQIVSQAGMHPGMVNRPKGVAVDQAGRVYVVDASFDNVQIFDAQGRFLMHFSGSGEAVGALRMPTDIAISGRLIYVTDTMNKRVQVFRMLYE